MKRGEPFPSFWRRGDSAALADCRPDRWSGVPVSDRAYRGNLVALALVLACAILPGCASESGGAAATNQPPAPPVSAGPTMAQPDYSLTAELKAQVQAAATTGNYKALGELAAANPEQAAGIAYTAVTAVSTEERKVMACVQAIVVTAPSKAAAIAQAAASAAASLATQTICY